MHSRTCCVGLAETVELIRGSGLSCFVVDWQQMAPGYWMMTSTNTRWRNVLKSFWLLMNLRHVKVRRPMKYLSNPFCASNVMQEQRTLVRHLLGYWHKDDQRWSEGRQLKATSPTLTVVQQCQNTNRFRAQESAQGNDVSSCNKKSPFCLLFFVCVRLPRVTTSGPSSETVTWPRSIWSIVVHKS